METECVEVTFDELHAEFIDQIEKWSGQRVPGLSREEVQVEIEFSLWKAFRSYDADHGVVFDTYWYRVWMNHKGHLIEAFFRNKRRLSTPMSPDDLATLAIAYDLPEALTPPPAVDRLSQRIWLMLAAGMPKNEVTKLLGLTRYRFDQILDALRTPEVRALLA